jgi:hypothetical protein
MNIDYKTTINGSPEEIYKLLEFKQEIESILKGMYEMSQGENWSDQRAAELICDGGELWNKYSKS